MSMRLCNDLFIFKFLLNQFRLNNLFFKKIFCWLKIYGAKSDKNAISVNVFEYQVSCYIDLFNFLKYILICANTIHNCTK